MFFRRFLIFKTLFQCKLNKLSPRCLYFYFTITNDDKDKKKKKQFFKNFWKYLLIFKNKVLKIHKHSWLSITQNTNNSLTDSFRVKIIEIHIWKLEHSLSCTIFVFYCNNRLVHYQILSYLRVTCSCSYFFIATYLPINIHHPLGLVI